jgi:hypothetical protein
MHLTGTQSARLILAQLKGKGRSKDLREGVVLELDLREGEGLETERGKNLFRREKRASQGGKCGRLLSSLFIDHPIRDR